jgi:hypothetical protein
MHVDDGAASPWHTCECRAHTDCTAPANDDAATAAAEQEPRRCSRDYPSRGSSKNSGRWIASIPLLIKSTRFHLIILYESNFKATSTPFKWEPFTWYFVARRCMFYMSICTTSTTVTSRHGIILMLLSNVGMKCISQSVFGLESPGTL